MAKPSELFEGEESSLRKTFEQALENVDKQVGRALDRLQQK